MIIVGIDVAKDRLDVAVCPSGEAFSVERNAAGLESLAARLEQIAPQIVALEATGGFESQRRRDSRGERGASEGRHSLAFSDRWS